MDNEDGTRPGRVRSSCPFSNPAPSSRQVWTFASSVAMYRYTADEPCRGDARRGAERRGGDPPDRASLYVRPDARFGLARCCSLAADEAEAVLVEAAGAVAGGEE